MTCDKLIRTITTSIVINTARSTIITRFAKTPNSWTAITSIHTSIVERETLRSTITESLTITGTVTAEATETSIITATSTSIVYAADATEYPGCKAGNILISRNRYYVSGHNFYDDYRYIGETNLKNAAKGSSALTLSEVSWTNITAIDAN